MARRPALTLAVIAAALTLAQHWPALQVQFWVDEFSELRPWTQAEVWQALTGPWDPSGASEPYYRPLAALYYAASFEVFGFNPAPLHAISLALTMIAAWLIGLFTWRETGRQAVGLATTAIFILHPALPDAALAATKLHPSLIGCAITAACLLIWQRVRTESLRAWWPIWFLMLFYAGFKEDAVMIGPALVALQWIHARWWSGPRLRPGVAAVAVALPMAVTLLRMGIVPAQGLAPTPASLLQEGLYGPYHTLVRVLITAPLHTQYAVHWPSTLIVTALTLCGIAGVLRDRAHPAARLFVSGIVLMALLGAPLALISGPTRVHLVVLSAAVALSGASGLLWDYLASTTGRAVLVTVCVLALAAGSRRNLDGFAPCSPFEPEGTAAALSLPQIPSDVRRFLEGRARACAAGDTRPPLAALGILRWPSADRTVVLVSEAAIPRGLLLSHPDGRTEVIALPVAPAWRRWLLHGDRVTIRHDAAGVTVKLGDAAQ